MKKVLCLILFLALAAPAYGADLSCDTQSLIGLGVNDVQARALGCDSLDDNILPSTDDTYDIGSSTYQWQDGYFDGTVAADFLNVNTGGNTLPSDVGTTQSIYTFGTAAAAFAQGVNDANDTHVAFYKSDATDGSADTSADSGDDLGSIDFYGADGDTFELAAQIRGEIDAATGDGDMPGSIIFSTTTDGGTTLADRWQIENDGDFVGDGTSSGNIVMGVTDKGVISDADDSTVKFCGGSDDATANGAFLTLYGDDQGGADTGVGAVLNVGNNTSAKLSVVHNATETFAVNSSGATIGDASLLRKDLGTLAAAGTACSGGGSIVDQVTYVTASDNTKAVMLPAGAASMIGATYTIYNTVASKMLNVCPGASGNINAVGANTAVPIYGIAGIDCTYLTTNTWSCSQKTAPKVRTLFVPGGVSTVIGHTGGAVDWAFVDGAGVAGMAYLAASATGASVSVPITGLELGDTIVSFKVLGQFENTADDAGTIFDADMRQVTSAAAGGADASLGAITQVAPDADAEIASSKTLTTPELVVTGQITYVKVLATTGANSHAELYGIEVVVWRE